jgi:hypothetical protein
MLANLGRLECFPRILKNTKAPAKHANIATNAAYVVFRRHEQGWSVAAVACNC